MERKNKTLQQLQPQELCKHTQQNKHRRNYNS